jgi:DNA-directed RNA polymerase I and III subunit RPAC2
VEFCGYSIPHPSEHKVHLRIQTKDGSSAIDAISRGLDNLIDASEHVITQFNKEIEGGDYLKDSDAEF